MDFRLLGVVPLSGTMGIIDGFRLLGACCRSLGQWALLMDSYINLKIFINPIPIG